MKFVYKWEQNDRGVSRRMIFVIDIGNTNRVLGIVDVEGIIISSVVPPIMRSLETMCVEYFHLTPYVVGKDTMRAPLEITYPNPKEIGADRIVNAVGAIHLYDEPMIIIDFGTATTF